MKDDFLLRLCPRGSRVLDFGCGSGELEREVLARGCDAWGVGACEGAQERLGEVTAGDARILRMPLGGAIRFPDAHFDAVLANQDFERIHGLAPCAAEIARVLRPGGRLLALRPVRETLWEPHVGAPPVHRIPRFPPPAPALPAGRPGSQPGRHRRAGALGPHRLPQCRRDQGAFRRPAAARGTAGGRLAAPPTGARGPAAAARPARAGLARAHRRAARRRRRLPFRAARPGSGHPHARRMTPGGRGGPPCRDERRA
ncbi:methyltransferase domain-containing protein [Caldovatus sp. SYSU G05006]|uniref:Methyltransferase domain-containing protein n=1 Tax=Caldovatus aquaticus TaxID=2865671 RepID=A0ABS7F715_9PROT|nr:methyltransferase domain-containing protein [Caldovatus aquaticus]